MMGISAGFCANSNEHSLGVNEVFLLEMISLLGAENKTPVRQKDELKLFSVAPGDNTAQAKAYRKESARTHPWSLLRSISYSRGFDFNMWSDAITPER